MEYRLIPILITFGIIIVGFFVKDNKINFIIKRIEFTISFHDAFVEMINAFLKKNKNQYDAYLKCIHDVDAIQEELGNDGIVLDYIDHLSGIKCRNYQLFVNLIPEIRAAERMRGNCIIMERVLQLIGTCEDALQRHLGNLDRLLENEQKGRFNPFICFGEGIRYVIGLPIDILHWCGLLDSNKIERARGSWAFKIIGMIVTFVGLISSIITIVLGWKEASIDLLKLFN